MDKVLQHLFKKKKKKKKKNQTPGTEEIIIPEINGIIPGDFFHSCQQVLE